MKVRYAIVISILLGACSQKNNDITNQNLLLAKNWMDAVVNSDVNKMDSIMNHSCKIFGLGGKDTMNYSEKKGVGVLRSQIFLNNGFQFQWMIKFLAVKGFCIGEYKRYAIIMDLACPRPTI